MYNFKYKITDYTVLINESVQNRQLIWYYTNEDDYLIEEYYGTIEEMRQGFTLLTIV